MKKLTQIILFILTISLIIRFYNLNCHDNVNEVFKVEFFNNCSNNINKYYELDNRNIYTYCIKNLYIKDEQGYMKILDYIKLYGLNAIEELATSKKFIKDGGSIIYSFDKSISNEIFQIYDCNSMDGNYNIYISIKQSEYDFCGNK